MKLLNLEEASKTAMVCWYAPPKHWKTTLALGIPPSLRPCAYLDVDNGAYYRVKMLSMTPEEREKAGIKEEVPPYFGPWIEKGLDIYRPEPATYFGDLWDFASVVCKSGRYKSAVWDSMSIAGDHLLREVKASAYTDKRVTLSSGKATTVAATKGDFGIAQSRILDTLLALDDAPVHVFVLSHDSMGEFDMDGETKELVGGPGSIGKALIKSLPGFFDVLFRLETRTVKVPVEGKPGKFTLGNRFVIRSRAHSVYQAGDRGGYFPDGQILDVEQFWTAMENMVLSQGEEASNG